MFGDMIYKLGRKLLPAGVYGLGRMLVGRKAQWVDPAMVRSIRDYYLAQGLDFRGKLVIELGGGGAVDIGMLLLEAGALQVLLVDPKFQAADGERIAGESGGRLAAYRDLSEVPASFDGRIEIICSHFCLEHFNDLESLFVQTVRLQADEGVSHHRVDLSDHTYHILARYPRLERRLHARGLFHLRYSESQFRLLNDPKCYMNRLLLPDYSEMAARHGLKLVVRAMKMYSPVRISEEMVDRYQSHPVAHLCVLDFGADLVKAPKGSEAAAPVRR